MALFLTALYQFLIHPECYKKQPHGHVVQLRLRPQQVSVRYNGKLDLLVTNREKTVGATGGTVSYLAFFLQKDSVCFQSAKRSTRPFQSNFLNIVS